MSAFTPPGKPDASLIRRWAAARRVFVSLVFLLAVAPAACGDSSQTDAASTSGGTGGATGSTSSGGGAGGGVGVGGGGDACASGLYCGTPSVCCATGDECVAGACVPTCNGAARCDGVCCKGAEVCVSKACVAPGASCADSVDCAPSEFCEPTLGKYLPQPPGGPSCEVHPVIGDFAPAIAWAWTGSNILGAYDQVLSLPLVADTDGDGTPEVAIVTHDTGDGMCDAGWAYVRLLDGKTGAEKWGAGVDAYKDAARVAFCRNPALADLDGDGHAEIIAHRFGGGILALRADGSLLWTSTAADGVTPFTEYFGWSSAIAVADLDGDGKPEVISGAVVLDAKGKLIAGAGLAGAGSNGAANWGGNSSVADVDGDGKPEILTGAKAWSADGSVKWQSALADGYTAIADFDGDGGAELVTISGGYARVQDAATGALLTQLKMPGVGGGGPPTIADFDADGQLDFASAVGDSYTIFTFTKSPMPTIAVKWSVPTADVSSSRTGSSIFDFEGDGAAEVLYNDECYLRVYDGKSGAVRFQVASSSGTAAQYPIAVDVDGDHHTELVVVSDDKYQLAGQTPGCPGYKAGEALRHGVFVYRDPSEKWVRTRRIWNQHSYHVGNIGADGAVPAHEVASFGPGGSNTYRVSDQGNGTFNAPDLRVDVAVLIGGCPSTLTLRATVRNDGALGVAAGVSVKAFTGSDASGNAVAMGLTSKALLPGQTDDVDLMVPLAGLASPYAFFVEVDDTNGVVECLEDNNGAGVSGVQCPVPK
jgi:hypothetical protein